MKKYLLLAALLFLHTSNSPVYAYYQKHQSNESPGWYFLKSLSDNNTVQNLENLQNKDNPPLDTEINNRNLNKKNFKNCDLSCRIFKKNTMLNSSIKQCNLTFTTFKKCDMRGMKLIDNMYNGTRFIDCTVDLDLLEMLKNHITNPDEIKIKMGSANGKPIARITLEVSDAVYRSTKIVLENTNDILDKDFSSDNTNKLD